MGSFPSSVIISRIAGGPDPRTVGSGNPGTTNTIRSIGLKWGALVFALDVLKGALPILLVPVWRQLFPGMVSLAFGPFDTFYICTAAAIGAVLGHVFPLYTGFKGGKGVATAAGAVIALMPLPLFGIMAVFALVLFSAGMVSLSSIIGALFLPVSYLVLGRFGKTGAFPTDTADLFAFVLCVFIALLITALHSKNIVRILKGTEPRFEKVLFFPKIWRKIRGIKKSE